jgi:NADH-quinone oxidoreductase subunit C
MTELQSLKAALQAALGERVLAIDEALGEITLVVRGEHHEAVCRQLRDDPALAFDTLIDLCGMDYQDFAEGAWTGSRFAVVTHLLSVTRNQRVRLRTLLADEAMPIVASVVGVWPAAGWYEREAFDLLGIVFEGHPDLRRILTDYGFVGHPLRKDFPVSGFVEMRYDPEQGRVVYQPVSIEPRENVPRVIREEGYGVGR